MRDHNTIQLSMYITVHGCAGPRHLCNGCADLHGRSVIYFIGNIYEIRVVKDQSCYRWCAQSNKRLDTVCGQARLRSTLTWSHLCNGSTLKHVSRPDLTPVQGCKRYEKIRRLYLAHYKPCNRGAAARFSWGWCLVCTVTLQPSLDSIFSHIRCSADAGTALFWY